MSPDQIHLAFDGRHPLGACHHQKIVVIDDRMDFAAFRSQQQDMIRAIDANGIRPVIDRHFALEEITEAFRYQETNQHFGKICLDI